MVRNCMNCRYYEPVADKTLYLKEFDAHCLLSGDLVYIDDVCDRYREKI